VKIGDIVVADRLVQHDIDLKGVMGYQRFDIPLLNSREMRCCERLVGLARGAGEKATASSAYRDGMRGFASHEPSLHVGMIGSGDQFICDPGEKEALLAVLPELACVEMEGAAVAQVCVEHGVPFVVTRIISDAASHHAPIDFGAFIREAASVGSHAFVREFVRAVAGM
jgi:adenosylhomocysteine nucleosidase